MTVSSDSVTSLSYGVLYLGSEGTLLTLVSVEPVETFYVRQNPLFKTFVSFPHGCHGLLLFVLSSGAVGTVHRRERTGGRDGGEGEKLGRSGRREGREDGKGDVSGSSDT